MRKLIIAAMACLAFAGGSGAASPQPAQAQAQADEGARLGNQMNAYVVELAAYAAPYRAVLMDLYEVFTAINEGAQQAAAFNQSGRREEGRRWAADWSAERRAEFQTLRQRFDAISVPFPDDRRLDPAVRNSQSLQVLARQMRTIPTEARGQFDGLEAVGLKYVAVVAAAAGGDEAALKELTVAFFELYATMLRSEMKSMETALQVQRTLHTPTEETIRAGIEMNRVIALGYELIVADLSEAPVDRRATAAEIRASAARLDQCSAALGPKLAELHRLFPPGEMGAIGVKVRALASALEESRATYVDLAGRYRSVADVVEAGPALDRDRLLDALQAAQPTINRVIEMDRRLQAIAAG